MSDLKIQLQKEVNESLKAGNQLKRSTLGMLLSAIQSRELNKRTQLSKTVSDTAELEKQSQLSDEEIIETIASEVKKRRESVEQFEAAKRNDLADKEKAEIEILIAYLPAQLGEAEIKSEIHKTISELGASGPKDMGKVIGAVMAKLKGKVDGTLVSKLVKESLV